MDKNFDNDLVVYVLPVSGSKFVNEIALAIEIYEAKKKFVGKLCGKKSYVPDLVLAASGGNVTAYILMGGQWCTPGIMKCVQQLDSLAFSDRWVPRQLSIIPNIAIGLAKGSLYRKGYGGKYLFQKIFTPESITDVEIWTGTYNSTFHQAQFFCNKSQSNSLINEVFFNEEQCLYDSLPLKFANGDVDLLSEIAVASASIPLVVPMQSIQNSHYSDGGCSYPSPISVFSREIYRIVLNETNTTKTSRLSFHRDKLYEECFDNFEDEMTFKIDTKGIYEQVTSHCNSKSKNLRLFYFFPYQDDRINVKNDTIIEKEINSIEQLLHCGMLQDRNKAIDLIYLLSNKVLTSSFPEMTTDKFTELIRFLNDRKHYIIILYPHNTPIVKLTEFTSDDIIRVIDKVRNGYGAKIFYSEEYKC